LIFFLVIIVSICGCQKVFKEDELNKLSIESPDDLRFALAGLYYRFASIAQDGYTFSRLFANADDVVTNINNRSGGAIDNCIQSGVSIELEDDQLLSIYKPLYQTIACSNDILQKSKKLDAGNYEVYHLLGEVYFVRAYAYFWLVRIFGQIPLIDNVDVNYSVKKSSFEEIYNFIEKDLQKAINLLPNSNYEARIKYITPHRGSAKALLAEVYLNMAGYPLKNINMYANAAKMAEDVIDSADYFGMGLILDLADLWNGNQKVNQESVFTFYASGPPIDWSEYYRNPNRNSIIHLPTDLYFSSPNTDDQPAIQFFNSFPNSYRKDLTYQTLRVYKYTPPCVTDSLNPLNTYCPPSETIEYRVDSINLCTDMNFTKYAPYIGNAIYLFRYSHTLLTYAEAKAHSGSLDASAYEAVNQVRRRANKVDLFSSSLYDLKEGLSPGQFADSVVWERAWEFCSEPEGRWFDLLRLEMIGNLKNLKYYGQGVTFPVKINMNTYFFPLPKADQMLNPNLE
jgi:starch-binding outer membrane protein, SusD/RagB family